MKVDEGGTTVLDARVMLRYDKDDYRVYNSLKTTQQTISIFNDEGTLYPNPADDYVYYCCIKNTSDVAVIEIYDMLGKLVVFSLPEKENSIIKIDLRDYSEGMYYYRVKINNEIKETGKLCIIKY